MTTSKRAGATPGAVADHATDKSALRPGALTLIGIFGRDADLTALVRRRGGRIEKVRIGKSLPEGRVAGIGMDGLVLEKHGKTRRIRMPRG